MLESTHWYVSLKFAVTTLYIYKEKLANDFSKILEKYIAAIDRTTIWYVIRTRVGLKISGTTRF